MGARPFIEYIDTDAMVITAFYKTRSPIRIHVSSGLGGSEGNDMCAFASFAVRSRSCGGRAVAYLEASLAITKTVWYFDFEMMAPLP